MHRQYLHVDSRTIAYFDSAPGDKSLRVALLIHAFPLAAVMWEPQFKAIPPGWRFLAIDLRGFGGSTMSEDDEQAARIDDFASDVIDLLGELELANVVLGGVSMGGYVTFAVLRRSPDIATGVILSDTRSTADSLEARSNRRNLLAVLDREGSGGVAREMMEKLIGRTTLVERPEVEALLRRWIKQQSPAAIRGAAERMMERPDSLAVLQSLRVPALIVVGDEDVLTPVEESRRMQAACPGAELVIVTRSGHLPNLEQPEAFNRAVTAFLSRL